VGLGHGRRRLARDGVPCKDSIAPAYRHNWKCVISGLSCASGNCLHAASWFKAASLASSQASSTTVTEQFPFVARCQMSIKEPPCNLFVI
jgi:hypothetical protein